MEVSRRVLLLKYTLSTFAALQSTRVPTPSCATWGRIRSSCWGRGTARRRSTGGGAKRPYGCVSPKSTSMASGFKRRFRSRRGFESRFASALLSMSSSRPTGHRQRSRALSSAPTPATPHQKPPSQSGNEPPRPLTTSASLRTRGSENGSVACALTPESVEDVAIACNSSGSKNSPGHRPCGQAAECASVTSCSATAPRATVTRRKFLKTLAWTAKLGMITEPGTSAAHRQNLLSADAAPLPAMATSMRLVRHRRREVATLGAEARARAAGGAPADREGRHRSMT
mmetsp:Transcript_81920/g.228319  ORF Transcript_81920/g.228319 Transcript_81920/m.228319 type:complete len:285 (+) Transcript_81920:505-1359(+)